MDENDDNPWDWLWTQLTDQTGNDPVNSGGTPATVASRTNYSNPLDGQEFLVADAGLPAASTAGLTHKFALGGQPVSYNANNMARPGVNPNRVADAFGTAGKFVAGQDVTTAGLLATAGKDAIPAIRGVDHALGSTGIGLSLDIAANAARAGSEIRAGKDPNQAVAEAAGRVIAGNGIGIGTGLIIDALLTVMFPPLGAAAAAAGIAGGAAASYGADRAGITDAAGRTLAPLFKW